MPNKIAPASYKRRKTVFNAFEHYLHIERSENKSSSLFKAVYKLYKKCNLITKDIAHFEINNVVTAVANTTSALFWNFYHIYSDPVLLDRIRAEVTTTLSEIIDEIESQHYVLNVIKLQTVCSLINSVHQKVLRFRAFNASFRLVINDVMLQAPFLLKKKNSFVFMSNHVIHQDTAVWGSNAREFVPDRFLHQAQKIHQGAFLTFDNGSALCPGRHLATTTIVAVVAMFVLRYEARPVNERWINPTLNKINHVQIIPPSDQDILLNITPREGLKDES